MATSKHFTVEIKPTIPGERQSVNSAVYSDNDVIFDWEAFDIPSGAAKLVSITLIEKGKDGAKPTAADIDFLFAKTIDGVAPSTLGTSNSTANGSPGLTNNIIGYTKIDSLDYGNAPFDHFGVAASGSGAAASNIPAVVLQGEPNTGTTKGFDRLYIAACSGDNSRSYGTTVLVRGAITADNTTTIPTDAGSDDDPNAENVFAVGDVIETGTGDTVGTIASISAFDTDHQDIILTANNVEAIADNEELFNVNPIKIILSFEK